jgi:hypothetical protein
MNTPLPKVLSGAIAGVWNLPQDRIYLNVRNEDGAFARTSPVPRVYHVQLVGSRRAHGKQEALKGADNYEYEYTDGMMLGYQVGTCT